MVKPKKFAFGVCVFLLAASARGTEIFVSPNGDDANSGASTSQPFKSILRASLAAMPGDTVSLLPGTYDETIVPARSGTTGSPITYRGHGPLRAVLRPATWRKVAIEIRSLAHIVIDGIDIDGVMEGPNARLNSFVTIVDSNNVSVRNGTFENARGWAGISINNSSYVVIEDNLIDGVGGLNYPSETADYGDVLEIRHGDPHHILIQRNVLRHGGHDLLRVTGRDCVIQDNELNNSYSDRLGIGRGNRAGSLLGSDNIYQRNLVTGAGTSSDGNIVNSLHKIEGQNNIVRQNVFFDGNGHALTSSAGSWSPITANIYIYNNTMYKFGGGVWHSRFYESGETIGENIFANNLVVDSRLDPRSKTGAPSSLADADVVFVMGLAQKGPTANSHVRNNLFSPRSGLTPIVNVYGFIGRVDFPTAARTYPGFFADNKHGRATFISDSPKSHRDFGLRAGSRGIDEGGFLTTIIGTGSSKNIRVVDSRFFTDGKGLIAGDLVRLQGTDGVARVMGVDHNDGTLALDRTFTFSDGQGIALKFDGTAPDIGAKEFAVAAARAPAPPTLGY